MMESAQKYIFAQPDALGSAKVDRKGGILYGVAVITEGPALGHGMLVDATTLEQVKACAETYRGGLKVKMDHWSTVNDIVGYLRNFRIEENVLRADLQLLNSAPTREYVLELAETIPDTFGLSIAFAGVDERSQSESGMEIVLARCAEIYSADLVDDPAANPTGLFAAPCGGKKPEELSTPPEPAPAAALEDSPSPKSNLEMTEEMMAEFASKFEELTAPLFQRLQALEDAMLPKEDEEEEPSPAAMSWTDEDRKAFARDIVKETIKALRADVPAPQPASPPAPAADPEPKPKTFEQLVAEAKDGGMDTSAAIRHCAATHQEAYKAYRARVEKGERITL